jgi:hypothetical protein
VSHVERTAAAAVTRRQAPEQDIRKAAAFSSAIEVLTRTVSPNRLQPEAAPTIT